MMHKHSISLIGSVLRQGVAGRAKLVRCFCTDDTKKADRARRKEDSKFLKDQLMNNPQFDRAFPEAADYKEPTTIKLKKKEVDFIKSLGLNFRVNKQLEYEDVLQNNVKD